jgi:ParB family transcriptional regulator, chromosome partitioning protein
MQYAFLPSPAPPAALTSDDRYTPAWLVDAARAALGGIDLDPASCAEANATVQAACYYTRADDGLTQPWAGRVFLNPPYSDPLPWVRRLIRALDAGDVSAAVVVTACAASPTWAQLLSARAAAVCFLGRRVNFWPRRPGDNGNAGDNLVWYLGQDRDRVVAAFNPCGVVR